MTRVGVPLLVVAVTALTAVIAGLAAGQVPAIGARAPEITGGPWINSEPLSLEGLRGRVVLIDFWTYG
jgi:hypothetical protein